MKHLFELLNLQDDGTPMCGYRKPAPLKLRQKNLHLLNGPAVVDYHKCLEDPNVFRYLNP